jgi:beta-glucosidase
LYINELLPEKEILTAKNLELARQAAAQSIVLLKNDANTLPLKKSGTIALIGPLGNNKNNMLGTWAVFGDPQLSIPVFTGLQNASGDHMEIRFAKGANIIDDPEYAKKINLFGPRIDIDDQSPESMLSEALAIASASDVIVAVVGEATEMSGESSSRSEITLPECQKKLIRALKKTGKPLVIVLMSGRPLAIAEENNLADALLMVWHPGIEAGNAIADVLFGNYNPSGKLSMTFPRNVGQIPIYYNHRSTGRPSPGDEFQKFRSNYLDVENSPLFAFGYGLSYTTFEYSNLTLSNTTMGFNDQISASVAITNTGKFDGDEVIQLYIHDLVRSTTQPVKELKAFKKIHFKSGETKAITFTIGTNDLAFYHADMSFKAEPGDFVIFIGTNSNDVTSASFSLTEK